MVEPQDLDILKDIPGYKAIFRALIKSQIQHLVEQLSCHTDEECVLLTASLSDGTLTHLGSNFGKQFLDSHDDVKKQFLGFCLKKQLKTSSSLGEASVSDTSLNKSATRAGSRGKRNRAVASPYADFRQNKHATTPGKTNIENNSTWHHQETTSFEHTASGETHNQMLNEGIKVEHDTNSDDISYTVEEQTAFHSDDFGSTSLNSENQAGSISTDNNVNEGFFNDGKMAVKLEPVDEDDVDLELTGVEINAAAGSNWGNQSIIGEQLSEKSSSPSIHNDQSNTSIDQILLYNYGNHANMESSSGHDLEPTSYVGTNSKKKQYNCNLCSRKFVRKDYLNKHMLIHTGEKPYKCAMCPAAFRQRTHLRLHLVKHGIES